jgi:murein L,D-transpeptidase YafK
MKVVFLVAFSLASHTAFAAHTERATLIVVDKSDHLMYVYAKDKIIATYRVGLGANPVGHKQQEGDKRTPEGRYMLDYKNANSTFFKSIHISYPSKADKTEAKRLGVRPAVTS